MRRNLLINDLKRRKAQYAAAFVLITALSFLLSCGTLLFSSLLGCVDSLMEQAKVPDLILMHAGEIDEAELESFVLSRPEIERMQISRFLNFDGSEITIGDQNLAGSTQDNGLSVQNESMDFLLDMNGNRPDVLDGEIYLPAAYRALYDVSEGDEVRFGTQSFIVAGFVRDGQMNSMMASSKRFLVSQEDFENLLGQGKMEYLIEFKLKEGTPAADFQNEYLKRNLPHNGVIVSLDLVRMINALSEGTSIFVIFLCTIVVFLIALLCIRFILGIQMEQCRRETGLMKALGLPSKEIRKIYASRYDVMLAGGTLLGLLTSALVCPALSGSMRELYGAPKSGALSVLLSILASCLAALLIGWMIRHRLKKTEKMSALDALYERQGKEKGNGKKTRVYLVLIAALSACFAILMAVPANLLNTISSSGFVANMGIGNAQFRADLNQSPSLEDELEQIKEALDGSQSVDAFAVMKTWQVPFETPKGETGSVLTETGPLDVFPLKYLKGRAPENGSEIALSVLEAEELGLEPNDRITLLPDGQSRDVLVTGIYADITNGGKTARMTGLETNMKPVWGIVYFSLDPDLDKTGWLEEAGQTEAFENVEILDMKAYVAEVYSQLLEQLRAASWLIDGLSLVILFVVLALCLHLMIEQNRMEISLQKALGIGTVRLEKAWMKKGILPAAAGLIAGLLLGAAGGEKLFALLLSSFGAPGFHFVINWFAMLAGIPAAVLITALVSVWMEVRKIQAVSPLESCRGME